MIVLDSSAVVALLVDNRGVGAWVSNQLRGEWLLAPDLLPAEVDNVLRRHLASSRISKESAGLAHSNLATMPIDLFSYRPFADRVWELRGSVSSYDAWHVALAEGFDAGLITLDRRLATAPGPSCEFLLPPAA